MPILDKDKSGQLRTARLVLGFHESDTPQYVDDALELAWQYGSRSVFALVVDAARRIDVKHVYRNQLGGAY